jgi:hypothetical protein
MRKDQILKQSFKFLFEIHPSCVVFSPNTLLAFSQVFAERASGTILFDSLRKVKNQIDGQLVRHTKGRVAEFLANKIVIEELKLTDQEGSEAFLSGEYFTEGRYSVDRFLGHAEKDTNGSIIVVVDKVFEVKSFGNISRARVELQIKKQLSRIRSSDDFLNIDTFPAKIRISEKAQYIIIAPKDVHGVDVHLPFTSEEIAEEVERVLHEELCKKYRQENLDWLFNQLNAKNLLPKKSVPRYERILLGKVKSAEGDMKAKKVSYT